MSLETANHCGTNFIYGGIGFRNCELKKYDQTVRYDESGTDMLFFDYEITVTGKIHQNDSFLVDGDEIGEKHPIFGVDTHGVANLPTAISTKQRLESYLMQPRLKLELYIGDSRLLRVEQNTNKTAVFNDPDGHDCDNGPKPQTCTVTEVVGLNYFAVEFTIRCSVTRHNPLTLPADLALIEEEGANFEWAKDAGEEFGVLNNRWSMVETRGPDFKLQRQIAGKLRVRHPVYLPNSFLYLVLPPMMPDMQRVSQEFTTSTNGLELTYRITDKQRTAAPPYPAIDWNGTHKETVAEFGATATSDISISLLGAPGTPKESLFFAALDMMIKRIGDVTDQDAGVTIRNKVMASYSLVDVLHDNRITLTASIKRAIRSPTGNDGTKDGSNNIAQALKYGGISYRHLGRLPSINSNPPTFVDDTEYLQGAIVNNGGTYYRAKKYLSPGEFSSVDWIDVTGLITDRDDRDGVYLDQWPSMMPYDPNSNLAQFANYFQNPSVMLHGFPNAISGGVGSVNESPPTTFDEWAQQQTNTEAQSDPANAVYASVNNYDPQISPLLYDQISDAQIDKIYTHIEAESTYKAKTGYIGIPRSIPSNTPTPDYTKDDLADRLAIVSVSVGEIVKQSDNNRFYVFLGGDQAVAKNWRDYYASNAITQVHGERSRRTFFFKAERYATRPDLPPLDLYLIDPNILLEFLESYEISPSAPKLAPNNASYSWEVEGYLTYVMERAVNPMTEKYRVPSLPWDQTTLAANALDYSAFDSTDLI